MKQPNRVKAAMRAGRKAYGYNLSFPSPWVIDILGQLDFDFVLIDGEHGPFGLDQLEDLYRTAERHNVTAVARVPDIGSSTILHYLDRGIMGILGPHIATEADACHLVRRAPSGRSVSGHSGQTGAPTTMPGLPTRRPTTVRQTNRRWYARCWKMSPCWKTSTPFSRCRASTCTALAQTILPKVLAIPASPTIRKSSRPCTKSHVASDRRGAQCNST